jgi:hypothetical protein
VYRDYDRSKKVSVMSGRVYVVTLKKKLKSHRIRSNRLRLLRLDRGAIWSAQAGLEHLRGTAKTGLGGARG